MILSILIPARNEIFLKRTIDDILAKIRGETEIIVVLDGAWPEPALPQHPRLKVVYLPQSIGQRAATNLACRISTAKYVMKVDAHCSFDEGFDVKMCEAMQPGYTMVPRMYNLHAFDWECPQGHVRYQSPSGPCKEARCGLPTERKIRWIAKRSPETDAMLFDSDLKFGYWMRYKKQQKDQIADTMSLLGAAWLVERSRYWELDISSEKFHGWGQQGTEIACKTWMSGGRLVVNKNTWFAHMFRTQGGDFGFPYPQQQSLIDENREISKRLFMQNKWDGTKLPFTFILEKFWPIPGWTDQDLAYAKSL